MSAEHRYGPSPSQAADLLHPGGGPASVVCLLHGGFWKAPYGRDQMQDIALDLRERGHAVWNIGYRRVGEPGGGWPGTLDDVVAALDLLAALAGEGAAPLDLRRVAVVGHSAGGHLAIVCTARRRRLSSVVKPVIVAGLAAITDLRAAAAERIGGDAVAALLGGEPQSHPDRCADASPVLLLPHGSPLALLHGTEDDAVPIAQSRQFAGAATRAGDDARLVPVEGAGHMDFLDPRSAAHAALCAELGRAFADEPPGPCATAAATRP